jgi:uncharacterized protein with PhoU and TrkA domain
LRVEQPDETTVVQANDVLIMVGSRANLTALELRLFSGSS